jgi:hydrogenase maturation protease
MTTPPRILVAGVGNIFLGDDAFGVEVVRRLATRPLPEQVRVVDFGIRGFDLTYALLEGYDVAILVDTTARGGAPGTLYVIEPEAPAAAPAPPDLTIETHGMDPVKVLRLVTAMGGELKRVLLVGCEPAAMGSEEEMAMGMSEPVQAVVGPAVGLIESLVAKVLAGDPEVVRQ